MFHSTPEQLRLAAKLLGIVPPPDPPCEGESEKLDALPSNPEALANENVQPSGPCLDPDKGMIIPSIYL